MTFSISNFTADDDDKIISVDWTYTTADGSLSNTHVLDTPAGSIYLSAITQATLITWLTDQLQNTTAELEAGITANKVRNEYESGFVKYELDANNQTYSVL